MNNQKTEQTLSKAEARSRIEEAGNIEELNLPPWFDYDSKQIKVHGRLAGAIDFLNQHFGYFSYRKDFVNEAIRKDLEDTFKEIKGEVEREMNNGFSRRQLIKLAGIILATSLFGSIGAITLLFRWGVIP